MQFTLSEHKIPVNIIGQIGELNKEEKESMEREIRWGIDVREVVGKGSILSVSFSKRDANNDIMVTVKVLTKTPTEKVIIETGIDEPEMAMGEKKDGGQK